MLGVRKPSLIQKVCYIEVCYIEVYLQQYPVKTDMRQVGLLQVGQIPTAQAGLTRYCCTLLSIRDTPVTAVTEDHSTARAGVDDVIRTVTNEAMCVSIHEDRENPPVKPICCDDGQLYDVLTVSHIPHTRTA